MNGKKNNYHHDRKKHVRSSNDSVHNSKMSPSRLKGKTSVNDEARSIMAQTETDNLDTSKSEQLPQTKAAPKPKASPQTKAAPQAETAPGPEAGTIISKRLEEEAGADSVILTEIKDNSVSEKTPEKAVEGNKMTNRKTKKKKHIAIWLLTGSVAIILLAYFGIALYFQSHFLPNTTINDMDCSYLSSEKTAERLYLKNMEYSLTVTGRDAETVGVIHADDIDMTIVDAQENVNKLLEQQSVLGWALAFRDHQNFDLLYVVDFNKQKAEELITGWEALQVSKARQPKDAYIGEYNEQLKGYEIVPEVEGTLLNKDKVKENVMNSLQTQEVTLDLEEANCYVSAEITSNNAKLLQKLDKLNKWTGTRITYDWNGEKIALDGDTIHEWILDEGNAISLDEEAIAQFVADHAKENDTYGKKRKFTTSLGIELTLPSGAYGWKTNKAAETEALIELIKKGEVCDREPEYSSKGYQKGSNDIGSTYVECDLTNQHLYLYQEGELTLETDFVSGNMSVSRNVTPPGVFGLTYKTRNAVLRGEDYETPVKYWMPFNGNVGMHDANWRSSFGGDIFLTSGSHGCINLPPSKAAQIYEYLTTGFPVICYYY